MAFTHPPAAKGRPHPPSMFPDDDDGFDPAVDGDVIRLLQENARLRALVAQLSSLVLKRVADGK